MDAATRDNFDVFEKLKDWCGWSIVDEVERDRSQRERQGPDIVSQILL